MCLLCCVCRYTLYKRRWKADDSHRIEVVIFIVYGERKCRGMKVRSTSEWHKSMILQLLCCVKSTLELTIMNGARCFHVIYFPSSNRRLLKSCACFKSALQAREMESEKWKVKKNFFLAELINLLAKSTAIAPLTKALKQFQEKSLINLNDGEEWKEFKHCEISRFSSASKARLGLAWSLLHHLREGTWSIKL